MTTQIWAHNKSGEQYVITEMDGEVVAAAGPLHYSEIALVLSEGFDSDDELVADIAEHEDEYRLVEVEYTAGEQAVAFLVAQQELGNPDEGEGEREEAYTHLTDALQKELQFPDSERGDWYDWLAEGAWDSDSTWEAVLEEARGIEEDRLAQARYEDEAD